HERLTIERRKRFTPSLSPKASATGCTRSRLALGKRGQSAGLSHRVFCRNCNGGLGARLLATGVAAPSTLTGQPSCGRLQRSHRRPTTYGIWPKGLIPFLGELAWLNPEY